MNADDELDIPREFWLNRELSKVKDPKRQQWLLEKVFVGDEGYQKFLKIMCQRKGAHEFETGEWAEKLPKQKKSELHLKKRLCIGGCGTPLQIRPAPWGEFCDDIFTLCPNCKAKTKPKENNMSENNQNDPLAKVQEALNVLATGKQTLKSALKDTLEKGKTELSVLLSPQLGFTFDEIFSDPDFESIAETFKIQFKKTKSPRKSAKKTARTKSKRKAKRGALKATILEVVGDGNKWSRPEIKKALDKKGIKTSNLYGTSGVAGLVKEGKLKQDGKGRAATYTIVK